MPSFLQLSLSIMRRPSVAAAVAADFTFTMDQQNVDLFSEMGSPSGVKEYLIDFDGSSLLFGSSTTSSPGFLVSGFTAGTTFKFRNVGSGAVRLQGTGGAGGDGAETSGKVSGRGGGGGGGQGHVGGAGGTRGISGPSAPSGDTDDPGAGGLGDSSGTGTQSAQAGSAGGDALDTAFPIEFEGSFEVWGGGGGGGGGGSAALSGGSGGSAGSSGSTGVGGAAGGAAGKAIELNGQGAGVITDDGGLDTQGAVS